MKNIKIIIILLIFYFFIIGSKKEQFSENVSEPEETPDCSCKTNDGHYKYGYNCEKHREEYNWCYTKDDKCGISGEKNYKECGLGPNLLQRLDLIDELKKSQDELKSLREVDAVIGIENTNLLLKKGVDSLIIEVSKSNPFLLNSATILAPYLGKAKDLVDLNLTNLSARSDKGWENLVKSLGKMTKLEELYLGYNEISDKAFDTLIPQLNKMTQLKKLVLSANILTFDKVDKFIKSLDKMKNLTRLNLAYMAVPGLDQRGYNENMKKKLRDSWINAGKESRYLFF